MDLEMLVNQSIVWAHTIERALHGSDPWTFRTTSGVTPAHRMIDSHRGEIVFTGIALPSEDGMVELHNGGKMVTVSPIDFSKGERLTWRLSLRIPTRAF